MPPRSRDGTPWAITLQGAGGSADAGTMDRPTTDDEEFWSRHAAASRLEPPAGARRSDLVGYVLLITVLVLAAVAWRLVV